MKNKDLIACLVNEKQYEMILAWFDYVGHWDDSFLPPQAFYANHTRTTKSGLHFVLHTPHPEGIEQERKYLETSNKMNNFELPLLQVYSGGNQPKKRKRKTRLPTLVAN